MGCGCDKPSPDVRGSASAAGTYWTQETVEVPRFAAMGAVDFMARNLEAAYDAAMERYAGADAWEQVECYARDLHALAKAVVSEAVVS